MTTAVVVKESVSAHLTPSAVWEELRKGSFGILSYATPVGEPRCAGVVYKALGRRLYVATDPDSWKARHIGRTGRIAMTVPVRRGGLLSLVAPIPPATISFHGSAVVHAADAPEVRRMIDELKALLPEERRASAAIIEIHPEDTFLTYGLGVSLNQMRDPDAARARVPIA